MTRAVEAGAGCRFCAAAGPATRRATATPAAALPLLFVIHRARGRMYCSAVERLAAPECSASGKRRTSPARRESPSRGVGSPEATAYSCRQGEPAPLLGAGQELVLQPDDLDERGDGVQVRKLHPAPAHAGRHRSVTDRLTQRLGHAVADGELALLELRQHERAAHTRLHRMEVAELAPADLLP